LAIAAPISDEADWIGFPTKLCRYSVAGTRAVSEVVLLDADNDQLARWIDSACRTAKVNDFVVCALRVAKHVRGQGFVTLAGFVKQH
jgi:hypothetical protein